MSFPDRESDKKASGPEVLTTEVLHSYVADANRQLRLDLVENDTSLCDFLTGANDQLRKELVEIREKREKREAELVAIVEKTREDYGKHGKDIDTLDQKIRGMRLGVVLSLFFYFVDIIGPRGLGILLFLLFLL